MFIDKDFLLQEIRKLQNRQKRVLLAIDGRCASGKTTLAAQLKKELHCPVIPMDHFFLRPEQRTEERFREPGSNVDYERFLQEVLTPLQIGISFSYRPFDCHTMNFADAVQVTVAEKAVTIVEGSYSCHPKLWDAYDMHLFMTTDRQTQMQRIREREGENKAAVFEQKWIPLEERYFSYYSLEKKCEYAMRT